MSLKVKKKKTTCTFQTINRLFIWMEKRKEIKAEQIFCLLVKGFFPLFILFQIEIFFIKR